MVPITITEAAKIAKISVPTMGEYKHHKQWKEMFYIPKGKKAYKVDAESKLWVSFLKQRGISYSGDPIKDMESEINSAAVQKSDTISDKIAYTRLAKSVEDTKRAKYERMKMEGDLIPMQLVNTAILGYIETMNRQCLSVGDHLADRIIDHVLGEGRDARIEIIEMITNQLSRTINSAKADVDRAIENYKKEMKK